MEYYDSEDPNDLQCGAIGDVHDSRTQICILKKGHPGPHRALFVTSREIPMPDDIAYVPDLSKVNPGIRETVKLLNQHGYMTTDSGDGKTHDYSCDRDHAYVVVVTTREKLISDADGIAALFAKHGVTVGDLSLEGEGPYLQAMYNPGSAAPALIDIQNVDDSLLGL